MLAEIENLLLKTLQDNLPKVPASNIGTDSIVTLPSIMIKNLKIKFEKAGLVENSEQQRFPIEQHFTIEASTKAYKLNERPLRKSVTVESPKGTPLAEKVDYVVNYESGLVVLLKALGKAKDPLYVTFFSRRSVMTLKVLKLKTLYAVEVAAKNQNEADALSEEVIKVLLNAEDRMADHGIQIKPLKGMVVSEEGKASKMQLQYVIEREMRTEEITEPMEQMEIKRKQL
jgi:hypothetical protein